MIGASRRGIDPEASADVERWRERLDLVARNLNDLSLSETLRTARAGLLPGPCAWTGDTAQVALRTSTAARRLWTDYLLLSGVVDGANDLACSGRADASDGIRSLLREPSIRLDPIGVPLEVRRLLDEAERSERMTPSALLDGMASAFDAVRDGLATLTAAIEVSQTLDGLLARMESLRPWLDEAGASTADAPPDRNDPVRAATRTRAIEIALEKAERRREDEVHRREAWPTTLGRARSLQAALEAGRESCVAAIRHAVATVAVDASDLPTTSDIRDGERMLADLPPNWTRGADGQADAWLKANAEMAARVATVRADIVTRLRAAADLTGRLGALRAKARTLSRMGDAIVDEALASADRESTRRPMVVDALSRAVSAFDVAIDAGSRP